MLDNIIKKIYNKLDIKEIEMESYLLNFFTSLTALTKVTKTTLFFDIQKSSILKISFISVCLLIIISAIIVLVIKIKKTENKKRERK